MIHPIKSATIAKAKRELAAAQKAYDEHQAACPGDHFWAYGNAQRERNRRLWILAKEPIQQRLETAKGALRLAENIIIADWPAGPKPEMPEYYDTARSRKMKGWAA